MSEAGDWSDDSDSGTPLPPMLAAAVRAAPDNMMETAADFDIASSIFGERSGHKVKKGKSKTSGGQWASSATPTPSSPSMRGTTPLSYALMAIDQPPTKSPALIRPLLRPPPLLLSVLRQKPWKHLGPLASLRLPDP
jgi:hypothetical protein